MRHKSVQTRSTISDSSAVASGSSGVAFITVPEAAILCRCSTVTIRRAIAAKRLTCVKLNGKMSRTLIKPADLEAYTQRGTQLAVGEIRP